jgi:RimJ/RimL family protein N-acetyltransferase
VWKARATVVGMAGLKFLPERQEVGLGYRLLPEYWGFGLATEASGACVRCGWEELHLARIVGLVHPANVRSIPVLEKCGLTFETMTEIGSQTAAQDAIDGTRKGERIRDAND